MKRVPAELALLALHQSGHQLTPAALRKWVQRGHITRGPGGYDLREILHYLDRRATTGRTQSSVSACPQARAGVTLRTGRSYAHTRAVEQIPPAQLTRELRLG